MRASAVTKIAFLSTLLSTVLVCLLPAAPAQAQAARTFVSAAGSDSNNCVNVATPCRHLAAAYAATAANGEIYVLDPANYGSLTITGPVSIEGHGWASIAPPSGGGNAITISANTGDKINIIGVVLDGTGLGGSGIQFDSGGSLTVRDCVIRNFGEGINFIDTASSQLFVSNTVVSDNGDFGVGITTTGSGTTIGVLDHVAMENNAGDGLGAGSSGAHTIKVAVSDSVSANNGSGIVANVDSGYGGTPTSITVRNSTIANNSGYGLQANGAGATILVTRSTITGNTTAWSIIGIGGSGTVLSYGDNNIDGNTNVNSEPPNPLTYK
jgi:hypothetical protein